MSNKTKNLHLNSLMFEKPKRKKKKSKHISNKRLERGVICEWCFQNEGAETHEIFGGPNRNNSIRYGAQMKLCKACHINWHEKLTKAEKNSVKAREQSKIMYREDMTQEQWLNIFGKNYL